MLPGCMSAWKKLSRNTCVKKISTPRSWIVREIPGRTTLTTTCSPVCSVAAWTWAIEADASGSLSKVANNSPTGLPRAFSMMPLAWAPGKGGTWS
jgi:hypothetical protein